MDYRVYFNRRGEFPWSVDKGLGTTELQTKKVTFDRVSAEAHFDPSAGDNERSPHGMVPSEECSNGRNTRRDLLYGVRIGISREMAGSFPIG